MRRNSTATKIDNVLPIVAMLEVSSPVTKCHVLALVV